MEVILLQLLPGMALNFGTFNPSADWVSVPYKDMFTEILSEFSNSQRVNRRVRIHLCMGVYS